jgi:hypothetical protein
MASLKRQSIFLMFYFPKCDIWKISGGSVLLITLAHVRCLTTFCVVWPSWRFLDMLSTLIFSLRHSSYVIMSSELRFQPSCHCSCNPMHVLRYLENQPDCLLSMQVASHYLWTTVGSNGQMSVFMIQFIAFVIVAAGMKAAQKSSPVL